MQFDPEMVSEQDVRREKDKARRLRQTQWWMRKIHNGVCHYCNKEVGRDDLTMDHIVPLSRGGKSTKGNIVAACKECNSKKNICCPLSGKNILNRYQITF